MVMMYKYYDKIYSKKDYNFEVKTILSIIETPKCVLDVGCGTGNHTIQFLKRGYDVLGIDTDPEMIKQAQIKSDRHFKCMDVFDNNLREFDLVIAMFNVVNYIDSLDDLLKFFTRIYYLTNRYFIFDCWNGLAAILDKPIKEVRKIDDITVTIEPRIILINQLVEMTNKIVENDVEFEYKFNQRLWTPRILKDLLEMIGFKIEMFPWMKPGQNITENTWKIMIKCEKII